MNQAERLVRWFGFYSIALAVLDVVSVLFVYFFPGTELGSLRSAVDPPLGLLLLCTYLFSYLFFLYIFFRADVKELFKPQERSPQ